MLNPETITILDPACGSGHILVEAYDLLKQIYLERGYQARAIPRLILEKNLYGLDIDDRAAQLAGFALLMKARADDRRLFNDPPKLNVMALQDSKGLDAEELARALQAVEAGSKSNAAQLSRHSGMDRRNPACRDAYPPSHPWSLGSGDPCRNDELALPRFGQDDLFPETRPQMSLDELAVAEPADNPASSQAIIAALIETFAQAKTFGSLTQIPPALAEALPALEAGLSQALASGDVFAQAAAEELLPLVRQAKILAKKFDVVVANPPYMGGKGMNTALKEFAKKHFPDSKADLFAMFMERGFKWLDGSGQEDSGQWSVASGQGDSGQLSVVSGQEKAGIGFNAMVTMQSWMFLSSFQAMREKLLQERTIVTMAHLGPRAFSEISGEVVQTTAFVLQGQHVNGFKPVFFRLLEGQEEQKEMALRARQKCFEKTAQDDFKSIPGSPVVYWVSEELRGLFSGNKLLGELADVKQGLATADNDRFLRLWPEVSQDRMAVDMVSREAAKISGKKWFPHSKGGGFRKWYGNREWVVNWENDGEKIKDYVDENGKQKSRPQAVGYYFRESLTWTLISSATTAFRYEPQGNIIGHKGPGIFGDHDTLISALALLNSCVSAALLKILSPTIGFEVGQVAQIPIVEGDGLSDEAIKIAKSDWDSYEVSWDFKILPWLPSIYSPLTTDHYSLSTSWQNWQIHTQAQIQRMQTLETENNRLFIEAYGLQDELSPEVPEDQITLARADREKDSQRLISYAIGCMMGRYRLDKPGLIYAHSGNERFWEIYEEVDSGQWSVVSKEKAGRSSLTTDHCPLTTATATANPFPADADGIVPITDELWFIDDAASRVGEFLLAVWPEEVVSKEVGSGEWSVVSKEKADRPSLTTDHSPLPTNLATNLQWLAESLGQKPSETPEETIRRYLADKFYKDHLQTYKKRPIYWLFSSGKQGAFQALVYLHRYHEGTLARLRSEYVVPLTGKIQTRIDLLEKDAEAATSTPARNKLNKDIEKLRKKHVELLAYDEKLRHYADQRITLDLDDGVKVNYGKFGDLLAEVKAVTGGSGDD